MRRNSLIVALVTLAVGIPVWLMLAGSHARYKLSVARIALPSLGLIYLAESEGYFHEQGLDVEFFSYPTGREALKEVENGRADLVTLYQTPILAKALEGHPLRVLASLHNSTRGTAVLARRDRGILKPRDLIERRVGVPLKTSGDMFFRAFLKLEGLTWDSLRIVDNPASDFGSRFLKGELDAIVVWEPAMQTIASSFREDQLSTFYSDVYSEVSLLAAPDEVLKQKPEQIRRFLRALTQAETFLQEHPEEAFESLVRFFPNTDRAAMRASWNVYRLELKLDNLVPLTLEKELEIRRPNKDAAGAAIEVAELIYPDLLEEVQPEAVTLYSPLNRHVERLKR